MWKTFLSFHASFFLDFPLLFSSFPVVLLVSLTTISYGGSIVLVFLLVFCHNKQGVCEFALHCRDTKTDLLSLPPQGLELY